MRADGCADSFLPNAEALSITSSTTMHTRLDTFPMTPPCRNGVSPVLSPSFVGRNGLSGTSSAGRFFGHDKRHSALPRQRSSLRQTPKTHGFSVQPPVLYRRSLVPVWVRCGGRVNVNSGATCLLRRPAQHHRPLCRRRAPSCRGRPRTRHSAWRARSPRCT